MVITRKKEEMTAGRRILLRMDLIGLASRFKIKRKKAKKVAKKIVDIIKEMDQEVDREVSGVIESIQPLKKTLPNIVEAEETQSLINEQMMQVFENSKKLMTFSRTPRTSSPTSRRSPSEGSLQLQEDLRA